MVTENREERLFSLTVDDKDGYDDRGVLDSWSLKLELREGGNRAPVANAGPDRAVTENDLVTLDGTGSADPDGDALSYRWRQVSGIEVLLSDAFAARPTFTAPQVNVPETLVFELVVSDGQLLSKPDTVEVIVVDSGDWELVRFSTDTPLRIPDNNPAGVTSAVNIGVAGVVVAGEVEVHITHTNIGDLRVVLFCPDGSSQTLHANSGGSADDIHQTYPLTACAGQAVSGDWALRVSDHYGFYTGTLDSWTLRINLD